MDVMELGAIGEMLGGVAVIGSLIYVGLQVRHGNNLAQSAAELEMGRMNMDYLRLGAEGELGPIYAKAYFAPDSLSDGEKQRFIWSQGMWFHMVQAMYRQHKRGLLPDSSWNPLLVTLAGVLEHSPILREVWSSNGMYLAQDFRESVNEVRPQIGESDFWSIPEVSRPRGE